jgi:hypothetical protein
VCAGFSRSSTCAVIPRAEPSASAAMSVARKRWAHGANRGVKMALSANGAVLPTAPAPTSTGQGACSAARLDVPGPRTMQEEEASEGLHAAETVRWIAIQRGTTQASHGRKITVTARSVNHRTVLENIGTTGKRAFPFVLGNVTTTSGNDPVSLRLSDLRRKAFKLLLQEEQSHDAETRHVRERVSVLVAE